MENICKQSMRNKNTLCELHAGISFAEFNSCYRSCQELDTQTRWKGLSCNALTLLPGLHAFKNQRIFDCRLGYNNSYSSAGMSAFSNNYLMHFSSQLIFSLSNYELYLHDTIIAASRPGVF